jgi:hypothetical protein
MIIGISGKIGSGKDTIGKIIQFLTDKNKLSLEEGLGLVEYNSTWEIKKFAGKLKQIVSILTGISVEDLEKQEVKDRVLGEEWDKLQVTYSDGYDEVVEIFPINFDFNTLLDAKGRTAYIHKKEALKMTVRQLLQEIGTEAMRNVIHPNIWVNALFVDYKKEAINWDSDGNTTVESFPNWIITDLRFPNEMQAVKDRGGITIRVNNPYIRYSDGSYRAKSKMMGDFDNKHPSETALDNAEFDYTIENNGTIEDLVEKVRVILTKEKLI